MPNDDEFSLDFTNLAPAPPPPAATPVPPPAAPVAEKPGLTLELVPVDAPAPKPDVMELSFDMPAPAAEQSPAQQTSEPTPAARPRAAIPPAMIEAAHLFARGDDLGASKRLETALKTGERLGDYAQRAWLALFDVLQPLGRYDAYTKLALAYAKRFETSPPTWREMPAIEIPAEAPEGDGCALPVSLDAKVADVLKKLAQQVGSDDAVLIDARAVRALDDNGCILLLRMLTSLRKAGKACAVRGSDSLIGLLVQLTPVGERAHEPMWLLLLDLYQRAGKQAEFDDAAINFAVTFELSPPSYDPAAVVDLPMPGDDDDAQPSAPVAEPVAAPVATDTLSGSLKGCRADAFVAMMAPTADGSPRVIDASTLVRVDDASATALVQAAAVAGGLGPRVVINGLPQLVDVLLREHGLDAHADLNLRKY